MTNTPTSATKFQMPSSSDQLIWDICFSVYKYPCINVAIDIGLFPLLHNNPLTIAEIQESLKLGSRGTEALLAVISSMGLLTKQIDKYYLTDVARDYLLPSSPFSWIPTFYMFRNFATTISGISDAINKDKSSLYDGKVWESFDLSPELAKNITKAMHAHSLPAAISLARLGVFTNVTKLLDVGGGSGCFSISIASEYPNISCTIMDLPAVCSVTQFYINSYNVSDRVSTFPNDMFNQPWPTGYDGILFSNILHDWDNEKCSFLLRRAFDSLPKGGRVFLHEALLNDAKDGPFTVAAFSMAMLLGTQGKQFSASEISLLLSNCGFSDISLSHSHSYYFLVSASKA